jgi:hypothetical protein
VIIVIAGITLIVLAARKWDTLKWWIALGLVALAVWTAFEMGLFDKQVDKVKEKIPSVSVD